MSDPSDVVLRAAWGGREESVADLVDRLSAMLDLFESLGGRFAEPFWSNDPMLVSGSKSTLKQLVREGFNRSRGTKEEFYQPGTSVRLLQDPHAQSSRPRISVTASLADPGGITGFAANTVVVTFGSNTNSSNVLSQGRGFDPLSVATQLVKGLVSAFEPDCVSLDSRELLERQAVRGVDVPKIGYATWLSDDLVAGDLSGIGPSRQERYLAGTLVSLDMTSDCLVDQGLELVDRIVHGGLLRPFPAAQTRQADQRLATKVECYFLMPTDSAVGKFDRELSLSDIRQFLRSDKVVCAPSADRRAMVFYADEASADGHPMSPRASLVIVDTLGILVPLFGAAVVCGLEALTGSPREGLPEDLLEALAGSASHWYAAPWDDVVAGVNSRGKNASAPAVRRVQMP